MFVCNDCGETSVRPTLYTEGHSEAFLMCPHCKSNDVEEAFICDICGEYKPMSAEASAIAICDECIDGVLEYEPED